MQKIKSIVILAILILSSVLVVMPISPASATYTEIEIIPNYHDGEYVANETIVLSIYVTPQTSTSIDTVATDLITFTPDILQCTLISWGNLFSEDTVKKKGKINNTAGTIMDMIWGSEVPTNQSGYFANMTFKIINPGYGTVIIDTGEAGVAFEGGYLPFIITHNFTVDTYSLSIYDEYPGNGTGDNPTHLALGISVNSTNNFDIYWNSNATGVWKLLGVDDDLTSGRYYMSVYGVIESPYNQELTYQCTDYSSQIYHANTCPGKNLGTITEVILHTTSSGTIRPLFGGTLSGQSYSVSGDTETNITFDEHAPTEWTWNDIKNLDVYSTAGSVQIIVIYDLGFGEGEKIYWSVNATDGMMWVNKTYWYTTETKSPIISNPTPYDSQLWLTYYPILSVDVSDPNGDTTNISFYWFNGTDWLQLGLTQNGGNGTYSQATTFAEYSELHYWYVYADDGVYNTTKTFRFTMRDLQDAPYSFSAKTYCPSQINLSWVKPDYVDYVRIQRRPDHYPVSIDDGLNIYNGTGESVVDVIVNPGTEYFYSAWAFNNTDKTWNLTKSNALNYTAPDEPTGFLATKIDYSRIDLSWTKGTGANTTLIRRKIGSYPTSRSDGTFVYNGTGSSYSNTGLGANITYYYCAWSYRVYYSCLSGESYAKTDVGPPLVTTQPATSVEDTTARLNANLIADGGETTTCGFIWENDSGTYNTTIGTRTAGQSYYLDITGLQKGTTYHFNAWAVNSFGFVSGYDTLLITKPYEPTNLTVTDIGVDYISLSWDIGLKGADDTIIMRKTGSYPTSPFDGIEAYFGSGNSISVGGLDSNVTYYFRAWSYTTSVSLYSTNYTQVFGKTIVGVPIITTQSATSINDYNATLHATLTDAKGETCVCGFRWGTSPDVYPNNVTVGSYTTGQSYSKLTTGLSKGHTYYYQAWARNSGGTGYGIELNLITKPEEPQSFSTISYGARQINLSWTKGNGTDLTRIQRKVGSYPTNINDGTTCYDGTENYYRNMEIRPSDPLLENTAYYYKAWSYNTTTSIYSTLYASSFNTTKYLPTQTMSPCSQTNINRPPLLSITPNGTSPLTVWFYNETSDSANETFGNSAERMFGYYAGPGTWGVRGTLWQNVNNTLNESGYAYSMVGGNSARAGPHYVYSDTLEIDLSEPKFTKSFDLNLNYYASAVSPYPYFPVVSHIVVQYHDYTTGQWASVSKDFDTRPIGHGGVTYSGSLQLTLPQTKYVDAIRFYFSVANGGGSATILYEYVASAVSLYYIKFVPTTQISTQIGSSGIPSNAVFSSAIQLDHTYSWTGRTANSIDSVYNTCSFITEKIIYSNMDPVVHSIVSNTPSHACSVMINHTGGDMMNAYFSYYNYSSGHYQLGGTNLSIYNGTYRWVYPNSDQFSRTYYWIVSAWDGLDWHNQTFDFTVRNTYTPNPPNFNLNNWNATVINITGVTWHEYSDSVMMRFKLGSYPTSRTDGTLLFNSTQTSYDHVELYPNTAYYYRAWSWNRTDNVWGNPQSKTLTTLGPKPPTFLLAKYSSTVINITGIGFTDIYSDTILIRAKIGSYPTNRTDGLFLMNSSSSSFDHIGLTTTSNYYYSAWAYDLQTHWWSDPTQHSQKTNGPPTAGSFYPNGQITGINPTLSALIGDYNAEDTENVYFRTNSSGSWTTIYTSLGGSQHTYTYPETIFNYQDWNYWWSVNVSDGEYWTNNTIAFRTGSMAVPTVVATTYNTTQINLTWTGVDSTYTYIVRKIDAYPANRADGTNIYNGTGTSFIDNGREPGELCRYRVWSYNSTTNAYSTATTTSQALTKPVRPVNFTAEKTGYRTINLSWVKGNGSQKTYIVYKEDNYPQNRTDGTLVYFDIGTKCIAEGLKPDDYLNYYMPLSGTNNFGTLGDPFTNSYDGNEATKWDLLWSKTGNFSYALGIEPQRVKGFKLLFQDFYGEPGVDWNSAFTKYEIFNGTWNTVWTGEHYNTGLNPEWWVYASSKVYPNVSQFRFNAFTEWITPNLFDVYIGKLGYVHCFRAWSYVTKGGLEQYSSDYDEAQNRTDDTPPNRVPLISNMHLLNGTLNVNPNPSFNVTIADPEGTLMNIDWQYYNGGQWIDFGNEMRCDNGTYSISPTGFFIGYNTTYLWRVNVSDTADVGDSSIQTNMNTSDAFWFRTREIYIPPVPTYLNATTVGYYEINLTFTYTADKIYIERNTVSTWSRGGGVLVYNGTGTQYHNGGLSDDTNYYYCAWGYNATDHTYSLTSIMDNATTLKSPNEPPNQPTNPQPSNNSPYTDVYLYLNCTVSDPDGDSLNISYYWSDDTYIGTVYNVANNTKASLQLIPWANHDATYYWYVTVSDNEDTVQGPIWNFKTCKAWDLNADKAMNYLDLSILVSNYLKYITAGSQSWDINNDGVCNYLDLSSLVSHYGESY